MTTRRPGRSRPFGAAAGVAVVSRVSAHAPVPVHVPSGVRFVTVSSGGYASYALDSSGRLWAWGENSQGQLGTGAGTSPATLPVDVGIHLVQVSSTAQNVAGLG